jgi:hypothetical protein
MDFGSKDNKNLYLPTFKSNISSHPTFYNNTKFIANTKAFYEDLNQKIDSNNDLLAKIVMNSHRTVKKYEK